MKQIFKTNLGIKVKEVSIPFPGPSEIQVKVLNSLISVGTEASSMRDKTWSQKYNDIKKKIDKLLVLVKNKKPIDVYNKVTEVISNSNSEISYTPLGYSSSGIVISKGKNVHNFNVGDRVACAGNGFAVHGEIAVIPKNLVVKIPDSVSHEEASFTTVGSIAMHGIRRSEVKPGEWIIIYGVGLIGLLALQIAKSWGLHIIAIDLNENKLKLAEELGADKIINLASDDNVSEIVYQATGGFGADASIIYASTSSNEPINNSFLLCREKANIVIVGAVGMDIKREEFYKKEQNLIISTSYGPGRYDDEYEIKGNDYPIGYVRWTENRNMMEFVNMLSSGVVNTKKLTSGINQVDDAENVYKVLASPINDEIGVLFEFKSEFELDKLPFERYKKNDIKNNNKDKQKKHLNVGVIGAGGYVRSFILPFIFKDDRFNLIGLCNKTAQSNLEVSKEFNFNYMTGDYRDILKDPQIDLVIIGTRHNLHSQMVLDALDYKKNVFVEKPLSIDIEGIDKIAKKLENTESRVFVGFNRRYSSLIQKLKIDLDKTENPIMINFRINAGKVPLKSWVQDPNLGGGRIIGEVCHFIDLCNYIVGNEIVSFDIKDVPINNKYVEANDNFVLTINYKNGSLGSILYTSMGGKKQNKELLEVFVEGKSYVINDFINYSKFSESSYKTDKLDIQDKGRNKQIEEIFKCLNNESSLVPDFQYDLQASLIAIYAQEKLYGTK